MNYHVTIVFDDGVEWIARIRRHNYTSPPKASRNLTIQSEVATLKFLEKVAVPTPKVYDFALEDHKDNTVGVGYILMEKMPGKLLRWPDLDEMQREKIMKQLADVFVELHRHPFDMLGSLHETVNDGIQVGSLANEAFTDFPTTTEMHPLGPFNSLKDFDTAYLKLTMDLILRGELYTARHALDGYLIHRHLLDLIPHTPAPAEDKEKFYLKHPDDKGDHILVDDDLNITAIIDWEWALTTPPPMPSNPPSYLCHLFSFTAVIPVLARPSKSLHAFSKKRGDRIWLGMFATVDRTTFCAFAADTTLTPTGMASSASSEVFGTLPGLTQAWTGRSGRMWLWSDTRMTKI